jgi:oxygen-dependent protoporphyrinogen oxidase
LIDALEVALEGRITIRRGADVLSLIEHAEDAQIGEPRYEVRLASGGALRADAVFFGAPAHAVARALDTVDRDAAQVLDSFRYVSTATVFVGFHRKDIAHPLDAVGFIVPRASGRPILAGTWVSSKWQSRAPESEVLMRVFFGGAWGEEVLKNDDDGLVAIALEQFRDLMKLDAKPYFAKVFRFNRSNPQPEVGHLGKMRALRERLARHPGLHVAGSGYDGVGIPDCVRQAEEAAARIVEGLSA